MISGGLVIFIFSQLVYMAGSNKRFLLLVSSLFLMSQLNAQILPKVSKDSLSIQPIGRTNPTGKSLVNPDSIKADIKDQLEKILARYVCMPDQEKTWKLVRTEADDMMRQYWRAGKLQGTKAAEAYYIKMDNSTMTTNDIANHKMILIAGIAPVKPAEFIIIKTENACKGN